MFFYAVSNRGYDDIIGMRYSNAGNLLSGAVQIFTERMKLMFNIDLLSRTPIYEQLYKKILELILKQELKTNDKLPSVRELAKELGINPNTVAKTFQMLEHDKVIYSLAGRGSFVADVKTDVITEKALSGFDTAVREALAAGIPKEELNNRINQIS